MTDTEILDLLADNNNWVDSHGSYPCSFCIGGQKVYNDNCLLAINEVAQWIEDKRAEEAQ